MSSKTRLLVLFLLGIAQASVLAQVTTGDKPATASPDYSREAYVIEKVHTRIVA
jgi:hypothetical protein